MLFVGLILSFIGCGMAVKQQPRNPVTIGIWLAAVIISILSVALSCSLAQAEELHILSLDRFAVEQYQIINNRDPYYPYQDAPSAREHWTTGTAIMFDIDLVNYDLYSLYYRGRVHGETTNEQYREVALQFETGIEIRDYLNLFWHHESQHGLDYQPAYAFPLQNFVGARVTFYKRDR